MLTVEQPGGVVLPEVADDLPDRVLHPGILIPDDDAELVLHIPFRVQEILRSGAKVVDRIVRGSMNCKFGAAPEAIGSGDSEGSLGADLVSGLEKGKGTPPHSDPIPSVPTGSPLIGRWPRSG
jgi:hypothetical protein